ncbi:MAG: 50S ribosomal protein L24 [Patescibacteria group bacterium]
METRIKKIKKGDTVIMRKGKDRGKSGKVVHVDPSEGRVVVEGLNLLKKHVRPKRQGEKGEMVQIPRRVSVANVAIVCNRCNKPARVGFKEEKGIKIRICRRCKGEL